MPIPSIVDAVEHFISVRDSFSAVARPVPFEEASPERQKKILDFSKNPVQALVQHIHVVEGRNRKLEALKKTEPKLDLPLTDLVMAFSEASGAGRGDRFLREKAIDVAFCYDSMVAAVEHMAQRVQIYTPAMEDLRVVQSVFSRDPEKVRFFEDGAQHIIRRVERDNENVSVFNKMASQIMLPMREAVEPYLPKGYQSLGALRPGASSRN
jgi:hypothetical protein